jgi:hypothetical protein
VSSVVEKIAKRLRTTDGFIVQNVVQDKQKASRSVARRALGCDFHERVYFGLDVTLVHAAGWHVLLKQLAALDGGTHREREVKTVPHIREQVDQQLGLA